MAGGEVVLLLSIALGSLILGGCTPRKELIEGVTKSWKSIFICLGCKCVLLPAVAWCLAVVWRLGEYQKTGLLIMASVPSSPISNLWQWLSSCHIGLGALLTLSSNLFSVASVPVTLQLYLSRWSLSLEYSDILMYCFCYGFPIILAYLMQLMFIPDGTELHQKWKLIAILTLVLFTFLSFIFVGSKPLGMEIDPWQLIAGQQAKDYLSVLSFLATNYLIGFFVPKMCHLPPSVCRTLSIEVAMQNDWLALHIIRGSKTPQSAKFLFPVILYSTLQAMLGPIVMVLFKHLQQSEKCFEYMQENRLHDSFKGPGHFAKVDPSSMDDDDNIDALQMSLQSRHNMAVSRIFGIKDLGTRYCKPSWFLKKDPSKVNRHNSDLNDNEYGSAASDNEDTHVPPSN
eukprot:CAMPEP_0198239146 /NCGR_PEP_ID=MMETSP1446-20131203/4646_1 /TAXON_ID=1461542 ORGANISM="Unidentified sp, Strain CCMP2111" /NCGR_SAMPLE_ID=MMETSP1446 /ASSEMBLY_ACC=CAM_ASM_001112 /LENGTH=398 /DNA_ID=CAMNT_0043921697 /DNA_START=325 /DNA_END=1521 /DNA_ORIENTATION=+